MTLTTHPTTLSIHGSSNFAHAGSTTYSVTQELRFSPLPNEQPQEPRTFTLIQDAQLNIPWSHEVLLHGLQPPNSEYATSILHVTVRVKQAAMGAQATLIEKKFSTPPLATRRVDQLRPVEFELFDPPLGEEHSALPPLPKMPLESTQMAFTHHDFSRFVNRLDQLRGNHPTPREVNLFNSYASELAFRGRSPELTRALLFYHGPDQAFSIPDPDGDYPIHSSVAEETLGQFECITRNHPASLYLSDAKGRTPVERILTQNWSEALLIALDAARLDANVMRIAPGQRSYVHLAAEYGADLSVGVLARRFNGCLRHLDETGRTPLVALLETRKNKPGQIKDSDVEDTVQVICERDPACAKIPSPLGKFPVQLAFDLDPDFALVLLKEVPECYAPLTEELIQDEHFGFLECALGQLATSMEPVDLAAFTQAFLALPETQQQAAAQSYLTNAVEVGNTDTSQPPLVFLLSHPTTRSSLLSLTSGQDYPLGDLLTAYHKKQTLDHLLQSCPGLLDETRPGTPQTLSNYIFSGPTHKRRDEEIEPLSKRVKRGPAGLEQIEDDS